MKILVTGASGFVGQRLIPALIAEGHNVRAMSRSPEALAAAPWADSVELVAGDLDHPETLSPALAGIEAAYYLVHAMEDSAAFSKVDKARAQGFVDAAANLKHLIYVGGLIPEGTTSEHLRSRAEVGDLLRRGLPTTEFRAGPILGPGSASFEIPRCLIERLPLIPIPPWGAHSLSTIAIDDMVRYLIAALDAPPLGAIDVGSEVTTFLGLLKAIATARGLKRRYVPIPALPKDLAPWAIELLTPVSRAVAAPLLKGVNQPLVANRAKAKAHFPHIQPMSLQSSVDAALRDTERLSQSHSRPWRAPGQEAQHTHQVEDQGGLIRDRESIYVDATPEAAFEAISQVGGAGVSGRGWPSVEWAWRLRGAMDSLAGGPGAVVGRPCRGLRAGDRVDFWEVEEIKPGRLLRLRAHMRLPGKAWLELEVVPEGRGCRLIQSSIFAPRGLRGLAYWWALYPAHRAIFGAMLQGFIQWIENPNSDYQHLTNQAIHETHPHDSGPRTRVGLGLSSPPKAGARA